MKQMMNKTVKGIFAKVLLAAAVMVPICYCSAETDAEYIAKKYASWPQYTNKVTVVARSTKRLLTAAQEASPVIENIRVAQRPGKFGVDAVVDVYYDLVGTENQCDVVATFMNDGVNVESPSINFGGDVGTGVQPGKDRHFEWYAGKDWPGRKSDKFQVDISASETTIPGTWATVTIEWREWNGTDLDICAYWADLPDDAHKVGFGYERAGFDTLRWPSEDNRKSGPETVHCDVGGKATRRLYIHLNYYGTVGDAPLARITATGNGKTVAIREVDAGSTSHRKAETSDPGVVIEFDAMNTPVSMTRVF